MNFGSAIEAIKIGKRAARAGWNGKGMFVYLNKGSASPEAIVGTMKSVPTGQISASGDEVHVYALAGICVGLFEKGDFATSTRTPNINMKAADGTIVTGWLASQTDMLAEDWQVLDG